MSSFTRLFRTSAEAVAAALMGTMFATFILQVIVRYTARLPWVAENMPFLQPANFGWTLEFCLAIWVWLIFWGNSFVVRMEDHVTFDVLYVSVSPRLRRIFTIITGLAVAIALLMSVAPTWDRLAILRLKKTATLGDLFGDWIRMRDVYIIYMVFLVSVAARYFWQVWKALQGSLEGASDAGQTGGRA